MTATGAHCHSPVSRRGCFYWLLLACMAWPVLPGRAQDLDKPVQNIDEDITAFRFAPDGRIAYAVNRPFKTKQYDLEHDDIWIQDAGGKRRRIFVGEKFQRGTAPFTYHVAGRPTDTSFSPNCSPLRWTRLARPSTPP
jgi:hypothetical protein